MKGVAKERREKGTNARTHELIYKEKGHSIWLNESYMRESNEMSIKAKGNKHDSEGARGKELQKYKR